MSNNSYRDLATESIDDLIHQRSLFANAIGEGAVRLGIIAEGTPLTGPQVLLVLDDIIQCAQQTLFLSIDNTVQCCLIKTGSKGIFVPESNNEDDGRMMLDMDAIRESDAERHDEIITLLCANSHVGRDKLSCCSLIVLKAN